MVHRVSSNYIFCFGDFTYAVLNVFYIIWISYLPTTYLGFEVSLFIADGCWDCSCLFDDLTLANVTDETLKLYNPDASDFKVSTGTGPINKTEVNSEYKATCYKLIDPTSAPTSAPTGKPIAITSAPTGKPIAITSAPTGNPIAITSAPTGNPIATTSAPTGKPTAASKSSKSVKATKVPSAKSSKSAKRV